MSKIDIEISEVGPRDGLQSIKTIMPTEAKKAWIKAEFEAGVPEIEVGSFVPPSVLPNSLIPLRWFNTPAPCPVCESRRWYPIYAALKTQ